MKLPRLVCLLVLLPAAAGAQTSAADCEQAWAAYNEFKARTVMEPAQYPLTLQGAAVRAACGWSALPAPAGVDDVPVYRVPAPPDGRRPYDHRKPTDRSAPGEQPRARDGSGPDGRPGKGESPYPDGRPHPKAGNGDGDHSPPADGTPPRRHPRPVEAPPKKGN